MSSKLSVSTKSFYGLGQLSEGVKNSAFELFVFFYFNQVLGLSGTLAGLATALSLVADAIVDPMIGSISDGLRHRWGRRHPFMYAAAVPLGVSFALLFHPPAGLGQLGLFLWLLGFSLALRFSMALGHIPHMALGAELSEEYGERTRIVAYRVFFGMIGGATAAILGLSLFFQPTPEHPNGLFDAASYGRFGVFFGAIILAALLASALGTHSRIPWLRRPEGAPERFRLAAVWQDLAGALTNPSFRALFIGVVVFFVMRGVQTVLSLHMGTHFWDLEKDQIRDLNVAIVFGIVLGLPFWTRVSVRLDKKPTFLIGVVWFSVFTIVPPILQILGLFPAREGSLYLPTLLAASLLAAFGAAGGLVVAGSMMADIADEHELLTGRRQEGIFFGALAFSGKAASGVGNQIAGFGVDLIGFPVKALPGQVPAETVTKLGILFGPGIAVLAVISIAFLLRYRLDRRTHADIVRRLESRRAAPAPAGD